MVSSSTTMNCVSSGNLQSSSNPTKVKKKTVCLFHSNPRPVGQSRVGGSAPGGSGCGEGLLGAHWGAQCCVSHPRAVIPPPPPQPAAAALPFAALPRRRLCKWLGKPRKLQQEEIIARLWWEKLLSALLASPAAAGRAGAEPCCRMRADKMPGPAPTASGDGSAAP